MHISTCCKYVVYTTAWYKFSHFHCKGSFRSIDRALNLGGRPRPRRRGLTHKWSLGVQRRDGLHLAPIAVVRVVVVQADHGRHVGDERVRVRVASGGRLGDAAEDVGHPSHEGRLAAPRSAASPITTVWATVMGAFPRGRAATARARAATLAPRNPVARAPTSWGRAVASMVTETSWLG